MNKDDTSGEMEEEPGRITEDFHSVYEERPFRLCTACGETLVDFEEGFQINKAFHGEEVVMEYALCLPCHENIVKEFSEASRQAILEFHYSRSKAPVNDPNSGLYRCEFCLLERSKAIAEGTHFALGAHCNKDHLLQSFFICEPCMLEMNDKWSVETRSSWNRFVEDHFPMPPSDAVPDPHTIPIF